jgi:hypothetical protein
MGNSEALDADEKALTLFRCIPMQHSNAGTNAVHAIDVILFTFVVLLSILTCTHLDLYVCPMFHSLNISRICRDVDSPSKEEEHCKLLYLVHVL